MSTMGQQRAAQAVHNAKLSQFPVRWSILPFVVSMIMCVNLISMPMKAYITEDLPWTPLPTMLTYANFTQFNASTLTLLQSVYNQHTLLTDSLYYEDQTRRVQLFRLPLVLPAPIPLDSCLQSIVLGLPGAILYGPAMIDRICDFASTKNANESIWDGRGTCIEQRYFGAKQTAQCLWLTFNNDSLAPMNSSFVLSFAVMRYPSALSSYAKFLYRLAYSALVAYLLWTKYYKHCLDIKKILKCYGHLEKKDNTTWSYCIMIGDPTAMILANPIVAMLFVIDVMSSSASNTLAVLRSSQIQDKFAMFSGMLYLTRGVWFSYLVLSLLSIALKRLEREHLFANVDPTLTVFISAVMAGAMAFCSGNILSVYQLFQQAHLCLVPQHLQNQIVEDAPAVSIHIFVIVLIPLLYGSLASHLRHHNCRKIDPNLTRALSYSSIRFNPIKTRALFALEKLFASNVKCERFGGSMYALFNRDPKYQQSPTISFCGADCFVLCYCKNVLHSQIRLSLLSAMACNDKERAVCDSPVAAVYTFNSLVLKPNQSPQLQRPKVVNAWVI